MKIATLKRQATDDEGTRGIITFGDKTCNTLELPWRDKDGNGLGDPNASCINPPPGGETAHYELEWHLSPSKGWVYRLKDVPGRSDILIHKYNLAADASLGFVSEALGCISLGLHRAVFTALHDQPIKPQHGITDSKAACDLFYAWGNKEPINLVIIASPL